MAQDFYSVLGVNKNASQDEIKKVYRRLAHEHHPDKNKGNAEKFKEINEAYQVLSDSTKRRQYDQFGQTFSNAGPGGAGGGYTWNGDFGDFASNFGFGSNSGFDDPFDIFSGIFGGQSGRKSRRERGIDLEMDLDLEFAEAVFGVEKEISLQKKDVCLKCNGSGAEPGSRAETCPTCHGTGQIRTVRRTIFGQMAQVAICDKCGGDGKYAQNPCSECAGMGSKNRLKKLKVKIPAGVDDQMRIRVSGEGEVGYRGSNFGDLYLRLHVIPNKRFTRSKNDILSEASVSFYQAALGTVIEADTVDGKVEVKIPAGTQSGRILKLKGKGVLNMNTGKRGDHLLTVRVVTPTKLSKKEKEVFKKLAQERGESIAEDDGFWSKFTS
jgi:molecular chaperone DnaJ